MSDSGKKAPDWERIELDYRVGVLSIREIASQQGITHGAINKRAKRDGWVRDLNAKVNAKADNLVSSRTVSREQVTNERILVNATAQVVADVRLSHRTDIARSRNLAIKLLDELELVTDNQELFQNLGEMLRVESERGADRLNELYRKIIDLPSRVDSTKKLAETLKTLIGLEREAYNIDAQAIEPVKPKTLADFYTDD